MLLSLLGVRVQGSWVQLPVLPATATQSIDTKFVLFCDQVKRAMNRPPQPADCRGRSGVGEACRDVQCKYHMHVRFCAGTFIKVSHLLTRKNPHLQQLQAPHVGWKAALLPAECCTMGEQGVSLMSLSLSLCMFVCMSASPDKFTGVSSALFFYSFARSEDLTRGESAPSPKRVCIRS
jgi:hypothetical protein